MPMFPLESVLLPGGLLPLHVFEPRYRDMVRDCLAAEGQPEFGQVLITRGREAGGGDERAMVATAAQILQMEALDDGRYALIAVGTRRLRVDRWLADDPYPIADVADWPDVVDPRFDLRELLGASLERVRSVRTLAARVGDIDTADAIDLFEVSDDQHDQVRATYHLCAVAPIGPADRFKLLAAEGPGPRLALLDTILDDVEAMLKFRLS